MKYPTSSEIARAALEDIDCGMAQKARAKEPRPNKVPIRLVVLWRRVGLFSSSDAWEYGTCKGRKARRHRKTGAVQFVLWRAGEQGHAEDYWHDFSSDWWPHFEPNAGHEPDGGKAAPKSL